MESLENDTLAVHVHAVYGAGEDDGVGGSGHILVNYDRESSVFMTGLSLGAAVR